MPYPAPVRLFGVLLDQPDTFIVFLGVGERYKTIRLSSRGRVNLLDRALNFVPLELPSNKSISSIDEPERRYVFEFYRGAWVRGRHKAVLLQNLSIQEVRRRCG